MTQGSLYLSMSLTLRSFYIFPAQTKSSILFVDLIEGRNWLITTVSSFLKDRNGMSIILRSRPMTSIRKCLGMTIYGARDGRTAGELVDTLWEVRSLIIGEFHAKLTRRMCLPLCKV
jgi:hypothetical protein